VLLKGDGLNADVPRAIELLRAAAERGHAGAQNRLAHALANGVRVDKSLAEAAKWRLIARGGGIEDAVLDGLVAKLSKADRAAAEQAAQAWRQRSSVDLAQ
jgi:TPR repeat protein